MIENSYVSETNIPGLLVIKRPTNFDERGSFREMFRRSDLEEKGIHFVPVQVNHSISHPGVIRAIHTEDMQKLVYPVSGKMFAAFADVRPESPTFGRTVTMNFDLITGRPDFVSVFIPPGVGNSICAYGDQDVNYIYLVDQYWKPDIAKGIAWNDPDLNIDWPIKKPLISERDRNNPTLRQLFPDKFK